MTTRCQRIHESHNRRTQASLSFEARVAGAGLVPVVEPVVNEEKLRQLLAEQTESETLDYKDVCDLGWKRDEVELAKDLGAMQRHGGFVVIGADSRGQLTGNVTPAHARNFDEARLRKKLAKYIPEPFTLLSACHTIEGKLVAVIYTGPNPDCFAVFRADGQYRDNSGVDVPVFRQGDVFVRHGSSSERWRQEDIDEIRRCLADREKEEWRREFAEDLQRMRTGAVAQQLATGPAAGLTWRLDEVLFSSTVVELLRGRDRIPIQLMFQRAVDDAYGILSQADGRSELGTLLDRLSAVTAIGLALRVRWVVQVGVEGLGRIYDLGFRPPETTRVWAVQPAELWLLVLERVYGLGALAVRQMDWRTVRHLALRAPEPDGSRRYYRTWNPTRAHDGRPIGSVQPGRGRSPD